MGLYLFPSEHLKHICIEQYVARSRNTHRESNSKGTGTPDAIICVTSSPHLEAGEHNKC